MKIILPPKKNILHLLFLAFFFFGFSQIQGLSQDCPPNTVQLILPDTITAMPGDQICVDVKVNNFDNIVLFFFVINFNSTVLRFDSANPTISGLQGFNSGDITPPRTTDPDIIRILWSHPNLSASNLPDGAILLNLCFTVIGTPGLDGQILFNNAGLGSPAEFLDSNNNSFPPCNPNPGSGYIEVVPVPSVEPQVFSTAQCGSESGTDGKLELKVFYGQPPYTLTDNQGNTVTGVGNQSVFAFSNLPLGPRIYTVRDAAGRSSTPLTVSITDDPAFTIEPIRIKSPSCPTDDDGIIELDVTGGKPFARGEYFFDWGNNQIGIGQNELEKITNGTYTVVVSDSLGCRQDATFTLERSEIQVTEVRITPSLCEGRNNGIIEVIGSGGGPFRNGYTWTIEKEDGGQITPVGTITSPSFTPQFRLLESGLYRITAQDSVDRRKSCSVQETFEVTVQKEISSQVISTDPTGCPNGQESAVIKLMSSNGSLSFPMNIVLTDSLNNPIFDDITTTDEVTIPCIPTGTYNIMIDEGSTTGCQNTSTIKIQANTITLIDSTVISPACGGMALGSISVDIQSDSPPLNFAWSNGQEGVDLDSIGGLIEGPYELIVTDASGSEAIFNFVLQAPTLFSVDIETLRPILCPNGTGDLIAQVQGASGDITYQWSPDANMITESVLAQISAGTYKVTATDGSGCIATDSIIFDSPTPPMTRISNLAGPSCAGENSGRAVLTVLGNDDYEEPFFFESSTGLRGENNDFTVNNFPSGMGTQNWIVFSDGNCVFDTVYIDIPEVQPFSIDRVNTTISEIDCFGNSGTDGAIVNLAAIGPQNIQYFWPDINRMGPVQLGLSAGVYTVELSIGTCVAIDSIVITQPDSLEVSIDSTMSIYALCGGDNNTQLALNVSGGTIANDYRYTWRDENNTVVSTESIFSNVLDGSYTIIVRDDNDCSTTITTEVNEPDPIIGFLGEVNSPLCMNDQGFITIDSATGGIGSPYRYQVNTAPAISILDTAIVIPGNLTVRIFDQNGCSWDTVITVPQPSSISVSLGPDENAELGESINLMASINSDNPIDTIIWSASSVGTFECADNACLEITVSPVITTTYTATAIDINGCEASDNIQVSVQRTSNIYVPNAFSPEGVFPGNRTFKVFAGTGVAQIDYIRIFDRWGNKVHAEEFPQERQLSGVGNWNGYLNNDANKRLEAGVYMYVVQVSFLDGGAPEVRKGNVTLVR